MKNLMVLTVVLFSIIILVGCTDSDVASYNLSKAADQFEIDRRIIFYNSWQDKYMLVIEGKCSLEADTTENQAEITCKTGENSFKKHFLGLNGQTTYFVEQVDGVGVDLYHYNVIFKPDAIIPDIEVNSELVDERPKISDSE